MIPILLICISLLALNVQVPSANGFGGEGGIVVVKILSDYLSKAVPDSSDVDTNSNAMQAFKHEPKDLKRIGEYEDEFYQLIEQISSLKSPKVVEDCKVVARAIFKLKYTLIDLIGNRDIDSIESLRLSQVYQNAVEKFESVCQQKLATNCQTINEQYNSTDIRKILATTLTSVSIDKSAKHTKLFSPIKRVYNALAKKSEKTTEKIDSLEFALKNRQILRDTKIVDDGYLFHSLIKKLKQKMPQPNGGSETVSTFYIRKPCSDFMQLELTKTVVRDTLQLANVAEDKEKFLSIVPEESNCFEALKLYTACEMINYFGSQYSNVV